MTEDEPIDKEVVLNWYYVIIIVGVTITLLFFIKTKIDNAPFERDFLSKDFGLLQGAAMSGSGGSEIEYNLDVYNGKYDFLEESDCRVNFMIEEEDNPYTEYYCINDLEKQIVPSKSWYVHKLILREEGKGVSVEGVGFE